jgi:hypothetical protein
MKFFHDEAEQKLYVIRDDKSVAVLSEIHGATLPAAPPALQPRPSKKYKTSKKGNKLQREIDSEHQDKKQRARVSDEDKAAVVADLEQGMSIPALYEKYGVRLGVSDQWFYALRARLRQEGLVFKQ